jgi:mRNA-degrading endonuclease RelE of RelBE toxin-antitoxin system
MAYSIGNTYEADGDISWLRPVERSAIKQALPRYLRDTPTRRSTHRKRMEPNQLDAPWELRLGALRVFYRVDEDEQKVTVLHAGRKMGNLVYIRGTAYDLREEGERPRGP